MYIFMCACTIYLFNFKIYVRACVCVCVCHVCMGAWRGQKKVPDTLELEWQVNVGPRLLGERPWVVWRAAHSLGHKPSLQSTIYIINKWTIRLHFIKKWKIFSFKFNNIKIWSTHPSIFPLSHGSLYFEWFSVLLPLEVLRMRNSDSPSPPSGDKCLLKQ